MIGTVYKDMEQGSSEWFAAKMGLASSSDFAAIMATGRYGKEAAARRNYRARLVLERLTGVTPSRFKIQETDAMKWGTETEELARVEYSLATGRSSMKIGGIRHAFLPVWSSTDGIDFIEGIDEIRRVLEIKCFNSANHLEALHNQRVPADYRAEVQGELWLSEAPVCDFVSFDPDFPPNAQLVIIEVERDQKYIDDMMVAVAEFNDEVDREVEYVRSYNPLA